MVKILKYGFTKYFLKTKVPTTVSLEVMGKTKRVSCFKKRLILKLGKTNKEILPYFNFCTFFFKKKIFTTLNSFSSLQKLITKTCYTKNGLFSKKDFRILRVGKLSTFR